MESKNTFKAGDRVVAKTTGGGLVDGEVYVVESEARPTNFFRWVNLVGRRNPNSTDGSYAESGFEPAPAAPTTTVQKGDKFRVNKDCLCGGYANGDVFVAVSEKDDVIGFYDNDGDRRFIDHSDITFVDDNGEPWDHDPRTLRIQAGRYCKTRDGRKVGPMKRFDEDNFIETLGDGIVYNADGKRTYVDMPGSDLIAEWTSYSSCAAAEVDNLRDEYGPPADADAPLLVSITADTSALDAAIERVKAHLDDLEAHAARLGVKLGVSDLRDAA